MAGSVQELIQRAMNHHGSGELEQALRLYGEVLEREPQNADALHLSGVISHQQGRDDDAVALINRAIALSPRTPAFRNNLALALVALERTAEAADALRDALKLAPDFADALLNLGNLRATQGRLEEAEGLFERAIAANNDASHALLDLLGTLPMGVDAARLQAVLTPLLRAKSVNPRVLGHAAARLIERKHRLDAGDCDQILEDEIVRLYLQRTINVSASLEGLLTRCRARWLVSSNESKTVARSLWPGVGAVAMQCFLNEHVWAVTAEEDASIELLERRIDETCVEPIAPDEGLVWDLLVYACYRPLWRMKCASRLNAVPDDAWPEAIAEVLRMALREPLEERELEPRIESSAAISDGVSKAVQAQYEENPYPRWLTVTAGGVQDIAQRVRRWRSDYAPPAELRGPLRVLVAGCGTGIDAIDTALHLDNAEVIAIDLSRASLAYAMRKAGELGLDNLRFRQQDILQLQAGDRPFHVVMCNGVLHHMDRPRAGLERLTELLIPRGLIKLALYSRLAREPLMNARRVIRESGYTAGDGGIRAFRQRVIAEGAQGPLAELSRSTDFYSSSECRDLLFHVQETDVTLPELGTLLEDTKLDFLGFELSIAEVEQGFRREFPDAAPDDLQAWDAYERRHPHSFRAMYHFWCEKRGS